MNIVFAWDGLPPYAAECIAALQELYANVYVIGSRPTVPHDGMDQLLCNVEWLEDPQKKVYWEELKTPLPDIFIHSGWAYPAFNSLAKDLRQGSRAVILIDNTLNHSIKQALGLTWLRLRGIRSRYLCAWVPGHESSLLCNKLGFSESQILKGLYGANPRIFYPGEPLHTRPKRILFVGSLISRKGINQIAKALSRHAIDPSWEFLFIGQGPGKDLLKSLPHVRVMPFATPQVVAHYMRESRFLLLPSLREHWGVVVHEACSSGCGLLLSNKVGSASDLMGESNGIRFEPTTGGLLKSITTATSWTDEQYETCYIQSLAKAKSFGPSAFCNAFSRAVALYAQSDSPHTC